MVRAVLHKERTGVAWGVTSRNGRSHYKFLLNPTPIFLSTPDENSPFRRSKIPHP